MDSIGVKVEKDEQRDHRATKMFRLPQFVILSGAKDLTMHRLV
jgi:hypothetical protein